MNKLIENYILLERVSSSDFSEVFKSKHKITNELFAIKVVSFEKFTNNPKYQEQISNELRALKILDNFPHIVKFIKLLKTKNNVYLVYEYCEGGTLQEYEEKHKILNETEALDLFKQLVEGIYFIHSKKIIHGDLKPSNLLFKGKELKIVDFGFFNFTSNENKNKTDLSKYLMGSPIYMAPELFDNSQITEKSDMYAIGVILYEMLFGMAPFEEKVLDDLIERLRNHYFLNFPKENNNINIETENLLRKLLDKDPANRYSSLELYEYLKNPMNNDKNVNNEIEKLKINDYFEENKIKFEEIKTLEVFKNVEQFKTHKNVEEVKNIVYSEMSSSFLKKLSSVKKKILFQINYMKSIIELNIDESNVGLVLLLLKRIRIDYLELITDLEKNMPELFSESMKIPFENIDYNMIEQMKNDEQIQTFVSILMIEEAKCEETLLSFKNTLKYSFEIADYNSVILKEINQDVYEENNFKKVLMNYLKNLKNIAKDLFMNCKNEELLKEILIHGALGFEIFKKGVSAIQIEEKLKEFSSIGIVNLHNIFENKFEE